jgi:hypothetical protein
MRVHLLLLLVVAALGACDRDRATPDDDDDGEPPISGPCTGITCDTPPSSCHATSGTCQDDGSCKYMFVEAAYCDDDDPCTDDDTCTLGACTGTPWVCDTPPPAECIAGQRRSYEATGSCTAGACIYPHTDTPCPFGCTAGDCLPAPP